MPRRLISRLTGIARPPRPVAVNSPLFYFVRHGETDWNAERRLQGQLDIALNDIGRRQSAQCGSTLRGLIAARRKAPADFAFISSPLSRARETMEILRSALDLPRDGYAIEPRLAELSFGRWEGLTYAEVRALDGAALAVREPGKWEFPTPDGATHSGPLARRRAWHARLNGR